MAAMAPKRERVSSVDGLYVHYSPPRVVEARRWARGGDIERLQQAALGGHGHRLLGLAAPGARARAFLRDLPALMDTCQALHSAVAEGSLFRLKTILEREPLRRRLALCRDRAGLGLLHKAVYYDYQDIVQYLLDNFPQTVHMRDSEGRTALHYAAACADPGAVSSRLLKAGAERAPPDLKGRTPAYYTTRPLALRLPDPPPPTPQQSEMVIKPANIRIWCHDRDLGRLQQVVWRGQGARLRTEVSSQPAVRKFLEAVPHIMGSIKEMHTAVIEGDMNKLKRITEDPVPPIIFSSQDQNGLTPLHKAAGFGNYEMVSHILSRYPEATAAVDNDGRTALHWAAIHREDDDMYNLLIENGAEEGKLDHKLKSAGFYKNRPTDIDKSLLQVIPESPRIASPTYPSSWDWNLLKTDNQVPPMSLKNKRHMAKIPTSLPIPMRKPDAEPIFEETPVSDRDTLDALSPEALTHEIMTENTLEDEVDMLENENDLTDNHATESEQLEKRNGHDSNDNLIHNPIEDNNLGEAIESPDPRPGTDLSTRSHRTSTPASPHITNGSKTPVKTPVTPDESDEIVLRKTPTSARSSHKTSTPVAKTLSSRNITRNNTPYGADTAASDFDEDDNLDNKDELENRDNEPEIQDVDYENEDEPELQGISDEEEKVGPNDHDDEDVHVRGESELEYGDLHKADTADVLDVEKNKNRESAKGRQSRGSESTIEGIINADPEVDSLEAEQRDTANTPGENDMVEDEEVQSLIDSGNMEQLAALVLNGEGERLMGQMSRNTELQAFLDNVPSYMNKIKRVHLSSREGGLRELQAALDRRKFAIARDSASPGGATPLHVAVLFGHTPVVRYLAARFPETLSAVDFEGRTVLHYAAVLKDNGHFYNILTNMGANPKDQDDNGHTAEEYLENDKYLNHRQLLKDFGAEESFADEMLSDRVKDDAFSSRRELTDPDTLAILERSYDLLHSRGLISGPPPSASSNQGPPVSFLGRFLNKDIYDRVRTRVTRLDHNLFDVIWPAVKKLPSNRNAVDMVEEDFNGGVVAPDYYAYPVFEEFMMPLIKDLHCRNIISDLQPHPDSLFLPKSNSKDEINAEDSNTLVINVDLDPGGKLMLSGTVECSRNLDDFELPLNLNVGQLETVEKNLTNVLLSDEFSKLFKHSKLDLSDKGGIYYTMNEVLETPSEVRAMLAASGLLIPLSDSKEFDDDKRLHGKHWPYGRGVFLSNDSNLAIWLNVQDHMRVMTCTSHLNPGEIGHAYTLIAKVMMHLDERLKYKRDHKLGFLSARPSFLGNSLHFNSTLLLPRLSKEPDHLKHLCTVRGLNHKETLSSEIVKIGNYQSLGITELQTFYDYTTALGNIIQLEKDMAMKNSIHIAEMFVKIFRRKKTSLVDANI